MQLCFSNQFLADGESSLPGHLISQTNEGQREVTPDRGELCLSNIMFIEHNV
jgi:hypothetical protein